MGTDKVYDVIIVGGSYAGLSAALSLGRSLREVIIIDNGNPCNKKTPFSHNFITNDGVNPFEIREKALDQILKYPTVSFLQDTVTDAKKTNKVFEITTKENVALNGKKLLFTTGIIDTIPHIEGFLSCWGTSILHCPYCHGYEVRGKRLGVMANGDMGYELAKTIKHWANDLTLFTNGTSTLSPEEVQLLNKHNITVVENDITAVGHENGQIKTLHFNDTEPELLDALFVQLPFIQQCELPEKLGCEYNDHGFIKVSRTMETSVPGIYAAGDCLTHFRSVANAVAQGNKAGATINKKFIEEAYVL